MSLFNLVGIAIGVLAALLMCFGLPDSWFFSLLTLACLCGAMGEAYQENSRGAIFFLIAAGLLVAACLHALYTSRARRP